MAFVYFLQGKFIEEAERLFLKAVKVNSYDAGAYLKLGVFQVWKGNIKEARKSWQKGLQLYGKYAQRHIFYRSLYTIALGKKEEELTTFQKILTEEKIPVGLLNHALEIAEILVKCPEIKGIDTAITMIKNNMNDEA